MKKYHETWKIENIKQMLLGQIHNDNENDDAIFCLKIDLIYNYYKEDNHEVL